MTADDALKRIKDRNDIRRGSIHFQGTSWDVAIDDIYQLLGRIETLKAEREKLLSERPEPVNPNRHY